MFVRHGEMPRDDARAEKEAAREKEKLEAPTCSGWQNGGLGRHLPGPQLAEPTTSAGAANAVAHFGRAGSHDVLAPGTHKGGQVSRGVDDSLHDCELGQDRSKVVHSILGQRATLPKSRSRRLEPCGHIGSAPSGLG